MATISIAPLSQEEFPGQWSIGSDYYSNALRFCAKEVPGMRWSPEINRWVGYADAVEVVCKLLKEKGVGHEGLREMKRQALSTAHQYPAAYAKLKPHQREGVDFLIARGREGALLADEMGVMKSAQAIRAIRAFRKKAVIVCPASVVDVWAGIERFGLPGEARMWWPLVARENSVLRLEGTKLPRHVWRVWKTEYARDGGIKGTVKLQQATVDRIAASIHAGIVGRMMMNSPEMGTGPELEPPPDLKSLQWVCSLCNEKRPYVPERPKSKGCSANLPTDKTRIVVIHYDILAPWLPFLLKIWRPDTVVFDELHLVQGDKAIRTRAVRQLARSCDVRIGLTGTPLDNRPKDLFPMQDILSPGRYGYFNERAKGGGKTNFSRFGIRYCAGHFVQVTMDKVVPNWDGRSNEEELKRRLRYNVLRRTKRGVGLDLPPKKREIIDIRIPAAACMGASEALFKSSRLARQAMALSAGAKLPQVIEDLKSLARAGQKVVVFSHRRKIAEHLSDAMAAVGIPTTFVHGGVSKKQRQDRIHTARGAEGGFVFCCTYKTCGTGISLTFASIALFVELSYEPKDMLQAESRLHRPGQVSNVTCRYYIGRGSIDDLMARLIIDKFDTIRAVLGDPGDNLDESLDSMPKGKDALQALYDRWTKQKAA